ncbi:hypothetical protein AA313_de0205187 [Arthrobotrys entomopaga]|nr:hypothetical protein AA313_de0205187 [Arthrobotrys entomopaga]
MATIAEEAQCWEAAINYLQNIEQRLNSKQHQGLVSSARIRVATSRLKMLSTKDTKQDATEDVQKALDIINQPLSGSKEKLLNLFLDIMQLRRASANVISVGGNISGDIGRICVEICFAAISFSRRCAIAGILDLRGASKERKMILASVDHFLVASRKYSRVNDIDSWWELEDQRLQEILALAQLLEDAVEDEDTMPAESRQNIFEKVSVFYQQHSITLRKENETEKSIHAFKRSISCLESRSLDEMMTGNLAAKHERLGAMYLGMGDSTRAVESFEAALEVHLSVGDFDNITNHFADGQIDDLHNDEERAIAKTLSQYVKCCLELDGKLKFWDNEGFDNDKRHLVALFQIQISLTSNLQKGFQLALPSLCHILSSTEATIEARSR